LSRRNRLLARSVLPDRSAHASRSGDGAFDLIWSVVCGIPRGCATTYGTVARVAGLPGRARLVGRALKVAPDELNLPWHRVVGAQGRSVFPRRSAQFREQMRRLRAEGVRVENGRVAPEALEAFGRS
jgi:methylated-DNA-protein-cysteine methyltransferase related protein